VDLLTMNLGKCIKDTENGTIYTGSWAVWPTTAYIKHSINLRT